MCLWRSLMDPFSFFFFFPTLIAGVFPRLSFKKRISFNTYNPHIIFHKLSLKCQVKDHSNLVSRFPKKKYILKKRRKKNHFHHNFFPI